MLKRIRSPKAYGKTIWRSGEDDDAVGEFLGNTGKSMKKEAPDKPVTWRIYSAWLTSSRKWTSRNRLPPCVPASRHRNESIA